MNKLLKVLPLLASSIAAQEPLTIPQHIRMSDVDVYIEGLRLPKATVLAPVSEPIPKTTPAPIPTPPPEPRPIFCSSCKPGLRTAHAFSVGELGAQLNQEAPLVYFYGERPPAKAGYDVIPIVEEAPIFVSASKATKEITRDQLNGIMKGTISDWGQLGGSNRDTIRIYMDRDPVAIRKVTELLKTAEIQFDTSRPGIQWVTRETLENAVSIDPNALAFGIEHPATTLRAIPLGNGREKSAPKKLELPMYLYIKEDAKTEVKQSALNNIRIGEEALKEVLKVAPRSP